jgi:hypothetical protein
LPSFIKLSRSPFQKLAARSGSLFPTPSPPKVTSGGLAVLDSGKAEALADSLQTQLKPVKDHSEPTVIEVVNKTSEDTLKIPEVSLSLSTLRMFNTPFGVSNSARHHVQTLYRIGP